MRRPEMVLKLAAFEGPFDLLFKLIEKNRVNLFDIPVAQITEQFIEEIKKFPEDMEFMSGFVLMAATLLEIKSRLLVPGKGEGEAEDGEDPREALVNRLLEYKKYKHMSEVFREFEALGEASFYRGSEKGLLEALREGIKPDLDKILNGLDAAKLRAIYEESLSRREAKTDKVRAGFKGIIKDTYNIEEKIALLQGLLQRQKKLDFSSLFRSCDDISERVVYFLALLEMIKKRSVIIAQSDVFEDIYMEACEGDL